MNARPNLVVTAFLFLNAFCTLAQYTKEDWKERDLWMRVPTLFELAEIREGDQVADIGCHEGYLTFHLAKQVGNTGKVFAVDVLEYRLNALKTQLKEGEIDNVEVVLGDEDDPKLFDNSLDAVLLVDTYHEIERYQKVLAHIKKALKPSGRLLVLEKLKEAHKHKDRSGQASAHTLSINYVKEELVQAGFSINKEVTHFGTWNYEKEKQMWVLVALKD